ncbi:MAG TPA: beta-eliminating lyase-related protein [Actinomycetes bacterium]
MTDEPSVEEAVEPSVEELQAGCTRFLGGHGPRSPAEVLAEVRDELGDVAGDRYGEGGVVAELEAEVRVLLGKPAAVFMPSGTMAQQIALRVHAERTGRTVVLWHPTSHLELHEDQAAARLHGLLPRPVGDPRRLITAEDLEAVAEYAAVLLLELPQREIGGQLPAWDELVAQTELARSHGTAVHLDGARLLECLPHYGRTAAEVAGLFDSVYLSLYKGLGGIAGCVLAGEQQLVAEAREWRHRHGGTLFGMWPYAAAGLTGLRRRAPLMARYVEHAQAVAAELSPVEHLTVVPDPPVTTMMHLYLEAPADALTAAMRAHAAEAKVWSWSRCFPTDLPGWQAVELTVGDATLEWSPEEIRDLVAGLLERSRAA